MAQQKHITIGRLGEDIAASYLARRGFHIIERNYRKKWGELDIVAEKDVVLHFVEVKSGVWNRDSWPKEGEAIYRPEDHLHAEKYARIQRAVATYLAERHIARDKAWLIDLAVVLIREHDKRARLKMLPDIVL